MKELIKIQQELKAPKSQYNKFGKYKYRKCEDILEAVKPLTTKMNCELVLSDELVMIGERYYIKATAAIRNSQGDTVSVTAYAREADKQAGMDVSQITGSASSYARKYALNGLLMIDDTQDADTTNTSVKKEEHEPQPQPQQEREPQQEEEKATLSELIAEINKSITREELVAIYEGNKAYQSDPKFIQSLNERQLKINRHEVA